MTNFNSQDLYSIRINKLLGINPNKREISFSEVVIPNFIISQLSVFVEKTDSIQRCSIHAEKETAVLDQVSFSLKDVLHGLLIAATSFSKAERKQALEMVLMSFKKVQESLLSSKIYDLASLMNLAIENIQLACKNDSIQEQELLIANILDAIDEMNSVLDDEESINNNLETIDMSYENLQLNMSHFAAREISLNDL